jgi:hypothetical protein
VKLEAMRFRGVKWRHNPRELIFSCGKYVSETGFPNGLSHLESPGRKNLRIKGVGELYGDDCIEQFERLFRLFKSGGSGVLSIAGLSPVYAVFESLKVVGKPVNDVLVYEFGFAEVMEEKAGVKPVEYAAGEGETLWDASYKFGIAVETLLRLNPSVKRADISQEGRVIRLC